METMILSEARRRLSQLVDKAKAGHDVIISRNGAPLVRIARLVPSKSCIRFGLLKGKQFVPDDFDVPLSGDVRSGFEPR